MDYYKALNVLTILFIRASHKECWRCSIVFPLSVHLSIPCQFAIVVTLSQFLIRFLSKLIYGLLLVQVRIRVCPTNDNQDGRQNGCYLSVCTCGHSTLFISETIVFCSNVRLWFCGYVSSLALQSVKCGLQSKYIKGRNYRVLPVSLAFSG